MVGNNTLFSIFLEFNITNASLNNVRTLSNKQKDNSELKIINWIISFWCPTKLSDLTSRPIYFKLKYNFSWIS